MNAFHDLAEMTRDYGLVRYFVMTLVAVSVVVLILFLWGHLPEQQDTPAATQPPAATQSTAPSSY